ncbi:hypothetical protein [Streptomyces malaysiensis]|uniref:hypothetical protein n=1 Tax=Streptomyces malaysiensis TaxID=92644 RepID=UPI0036CB9035
MNESHCTWAADVVVPGEGLIDARGAHQSIKPATEEDVKAAAIRQLADAYSCTVSDISVTTFTCSEVAT